MISVDTSAWIELLRGTDSQHDLLLRELIEDDAPLTISEIVLTEILAGLEGGRRRSMIEKRLLAYPLLPFRSPDDFVLAASMYRAARRAGLTIRGTLDCLIAAPCVRVGIPLLHRDADFDRLAVCTPLQVHQP